MRGDLTLVSSVDPVLAFERTGEGDRILCVFNLSNTEASHPLAEDWRPVDGHSFTAKRAGDQLVLPPFGAAFFNR